MGKELVRGNIYIRKNSLPKKGDFVPGHEHHFDHTTYVPRGSVNIKRFQKIFNEDGAPLLDEKREQTWLMIASKDVSAGGSVLIKAEERHLITALEDNTEFDCIYSHTNPQGEIVQDYQGWDRAYAQKPLVTDITKENIFTNRLTESDAKARTEAVKLAEAIVRAESALKERAGG